ITNATSSTASVSAPGTYLVRVTKTSTGCFTTTTVNVAQDLSAPENVVATSSAVLTCTTTSTNLVATTTTTGVTYLWTGPGAITNATSSTASVSAPGTYTLRVTKTSTGCFKTTTVNVVQNLGEPQGVTATGIINCDDATVLLNATSTTPGVTYSWTGPNGFASNQQTVIAPTTGQYTVFVTNPEGGCVTSVIAQLIIDENCNSERRGSSDEVTIEKENLEDPLSVTVYPNPTNNQGNLTLDPSVDMLVTVELYSSMNIKVATLYAGSVRSGNQKTITFDTEELADGVYMYRIIYLDKEINGKLIITH
ncbi:MAG: T9SS type A sorting domain-containing protein, partial [Cyclobacteriaceae bacterium]|nr:T9SS type A sorting domain-containing protein [Cyclobacteriaceae bacterium]